MKTYICGHRNPDTDSVASAFALADLRHRCGMEDVEAICAGRMPEKAAWVFGHFGVKPIAVRRDIYVRVGDLIDEKVPVIPHDITLEEALCRLEASGESSLPVRASDGSLAGMLSPAKLLSYFLKRGDLSIPVTDAPLHQCGLVLNAADRVSDIRQSAIRNPHNHFPVVDESGKLAGTLLKRAFAEEPPFRIILVDHNETEQGIPGVDEIPVIEVVDHHRMSFPATKEPIRYTADVVGSTCTLVARMYRAAGLRPTKQVAGILVAGIVSDTLLFQSPTTTEVDRSICVWLEKLCGEKAADIMDGMIHIASPLASMSAEQAIASDAKRYSEGGKTFILAQIEETNLALFHKHAPEVAEAMEKAIAAEGLDFMALMVTDPVRGNSELLYRGDRSVLRALPYRTGKYGTLLMPGVLSRKKQLLPEVLSAIS